MAQVRLPTALVTLFPGTPRRLELDGGTVGEVLAALDARVPGNSVRSAVGSRTSAIGSSLSVSLR